MTLFSVSVVYTLESNQHCDLAQQTADNLPPSAPATSPGAQQHHTAPPTVLLANLLSRQHRNVLWTVHAAEETGQMLSVVELQHCILDHSWSGTACRPQNIRAKLCLQVPSVLVLETAIKRRGDCASSFSRTEVSLMSQLGHSNTCNIEQSCKASSRAVLWDNQIACTRALKRACVHAVWLTQSAACEDTFHCW